MPGSFGTQTRHEAHGRYPEVSSVADFRRNLAAGQGRIAVAWHRAGRDQQTTIG